MTTPGTLPSLSVAEAGTQSLASGTVGAALLATERALAGTGDWATARALIGHVAAGPVDAGAHTGLFYGAPAIAFLLHATTRDGHPRYRPARHALDQHTRRIIRQRLTAAAERIRRGDAASFAEYDLFQGLVGLGALLLRQAPGSDELGDVLSYLIRLTQPRRYHGLLVPGWWVDHDPDPLLPTPGGHANAGMAHGAAGILALLALATRQGHRVDGQTDAIASLCAWFDQWQQDSPDGPWWPQWITQDQVRTGRPPVGPGRSSWCYGAPGIARAHQLAAIATHDPARQAAAEDTLAACLTEQQLARLMPNTGICHGLAGLHQTAMRAAVDTATGGGVIAARLPALADQLTHHRPSDGEGFLTGYTGLALALEAIQAGTPPHTGWDACLLIA